MPLYESATSYTAVESYRGMRSRKRPAGSVRTESTGAPPLPMPTWWRTTHPRGSAAGRRPPSMTTPVTGTPWAARAPVPATSRRSPAASALGRELAEIFRIEVLQVILEAFFVELRRAARRAGFSTGPFGPGHTLAGVDRGQLEQVFTGEDRGLEPQGHGARIGRPGVALNHRAAAVDVQLGDVGVVLYLREAHLAPVGALCGERWIRLISR